MVVVVVEAGASWGVEIVRPSDLIAASSSHRKKLHFRVSHVQKRRPLLRPSFLTGKRTASLRGSQLQCQVPLAKRPSRRSGCL